MFYLINKIYKSERFRSYSRLKEITYCPQGLCKMYGKYSEKSK